MTLNVLIVDDSSVMRAMITKTLRMSGLPLGDLHHAANGQEGLSLLAGHWIDLVIVDLNMPVMDGETMIDRLRVNQETKDLPVLVISTEGSQARIEQLRKKGVWFIHKPFSPEEIRDTIKEMIGKEVFDEQAGS